MPKKFPTRHPLALAASLALLPALALAQTPPADKKDDKPQQLDQVVVTGIRASLQASIDTKKNAATNIEAITAEDVGKMPDKNIADSLSRLPGVNVQYGGALAMDEAERVSIRGTSPNLNLTTVNGHALSSGDWHVGDQGSSGRSVGFGLLPSQLIGQAIVYKTGQADITEGGIAGSVDIRLRKPLDFRQTLTAEASLGAVYATLPAKTDPQLSALVSWQNAERNFGVLAQVFREERSLRRDGQETFSYGIISAAQATASGNPDLAGKRMPGSLNAAMFEGKRERQGGYLAAQWKPSRSMEFTASAFRATLDADNYNSSAFTLPTGLVNQGWLIRDAKIEGDVITSARLEAPALRAGSTTLRNTVHPSGQAVGLQFDHNVREGAKSLSSFYDLEAKLKLNDRLGLQLRGGYTEGSGNTQEQPSLFFGIVNPNLSYTVRSDRPADYRLTNATTGAPIDTGNIANYVQMGNPPAAVLSSDKENYLHADADYKLADDGLFTKVKWGIRTAKHTRDLVFYSARWNAQDNGNTIVTPSPIVNIGNGTLVSGFVNPADIPVPATAYPSDWASGLNADFPRSYFRFDPSQIGAFNDKYVNFDRPRNLNLTPSYLVIERNFSAYAMADFDAGALSGNVGLRAASTEVFSRSYQSLAQCAALQPCAVPGAIVGSRLGTWRAQEVTTEHLALLPSLNLRYELTPQLIARAAATRTLGRPNYNELAGAVSLNNTLLTGTSGNPNLKPITSNNVDATLAWYFAPRAVLSGGLFTQRMQNYVKAGASQVEFFNTLLNQNSIYTVTSRVGVSAKLHGAEAALEMPVGAGFGFGANATYVKSEDQDGLELLGTSKLTWNARAFYEDERFSASVAYNRRSDYGIGYVVAGTVTSGLHKYQGYGSVSASLGYRFTKQISLHLDANNLNDPVRSTYFITENAPGYWHQSGKQYYLTLRGKM